MKDEEPYHPLKKGWYENKPRELPLEIGDGYKMLMAFNMLFDGDGKKEYKKRILE